MTSEGGDVPSTDLWEVVVGGRFGLLHGPDAEAALKAFGSAAGIPVTRVSHLLTVAVSDGWRRPEDALAGHRVLCDLEVLFWPTVRRDPLRLLRSLARRDPLVAAWPGRILGDRVMFSEPGRPDHYDEPVPREAVVLRARPTTFPDEQPYEVERI